MKTFKQFLTENDQSKPIIVKIADLKREYYLEWNRPTTGAYHILRGERAKTYKEDVEKIKNELKKFKQIEPIIIDKNNKIVDGQHRVDALTELGYKYVPAIIGSAFSVFDATKYDRMELKDSWKNEKINEVFYDTAKNQFDNANVYKNPTDSEMMSIIRHSEEKGVRIGIDEQDNIYAWNGDYLLHGAVSKALGLKFKYQLTLDKDYADKRYSSTVSVNTKGAFEPSDKLKNRLFNLFQPFGVDFVKDVDENHQKLKISLH